MFRCVPKIGYQETIFLIRNVSCYVNFELDRKSSMHTKQFTFIIKNRRLTEYFVLLLCYSVAKMLLICNIYVLCDDWIQFLIFVYFSLLFCFERI